MPEFLFAFPEHRTALPGGTRPSQSDIFVIARASDDLLGIAVEGKVDEGFDRSVEDWLGTAPSPGKHVRLNFLCNRLGLAPTEVATLPYQLLHRAVSAVLESERLGAIPMMLVHSWGVEDEGFEHFAILVRKLGGPASVGSVVPCSLPGGTPIWFAWVRGDEQWRRWTPSADPQA